MDDVITLVAERVTGYDEYGNETIEERRREVMCQIYGITRNEFYSAAVADFRPDITVRLSDIADYEGEPEAIYHGARYTIIRTYRDAGSYHYGGGLPANGIELILQHKVGDQGGEDDGQVCPGSDCCYS